MTPGNTTETANTESVVEAKALTRRFGDETVIGPIDLAVRRGERVALRGPNGSGKTTILRCLAGSLRPSAGHASICGFESVSLEARQGTGVSFSQERSFYLRLTAYQNLTFYADLRHPDASSARSEVAGLLDELDLNAIADVRLDRCSTGMLQQLALARALIGSPAVLLLDEPTRSLDEMAKNRLWRALEQRSDLAVIIATHAPDDSAHTHRVVDL